MAYTNRLKRRFYQITFNSALSMYKKELFRRARARQLGETAME